MRRRTIDALQWGDPRCAGMTAAIYCRKSTATEGRSRSRDEQLEICRHDAERYGFGRVVEIMEPEGQKGEFYWGDRDGRHPGPHRPELTKLVGMIERGEVQAVLAYKLNRLVRDNGVEDALAKLCLRYGIHLIVGGRDVELNTARGRCNNAQEAARAREWRDQISEDIQRDHDYKFTRNLFTRDPSCFGFRSLGHKTQGIRFIPAELEVVRMIFDWFVGANGQMPLGTHQIATRLMSEGFQLAVGAKGHKQKHAGRIHSSQVVSILDNCMYVGEWQHNGQRKSYPQLLIPSADGIGEAAPVITREIWDLAQARLESRTKTGSRAATSSRLLTGLVVCGACGKPMHVNVGKRRDGTTVERWFCAHRNAKLKRTCFGTSYASLCVEELDRWVIDFVAPMVALDIEEVRGQRNTSKVRLELEAAEMKLASIKRTESERLCLALETLDEEAFRLLAKSFKEKRTKLELEVMRLRPLFSGPDPLEGDGAPPELLSHDRDVLRTALHRYLRYIAVTDQGVIAYAQTANYVSARFAERDYSVYGDLGNRRRPLPPDLDAIVSSQGWISDKEAFAAGRRQSMGSYGERADPEHLVADWAPVG